MNHKAKSFKDLIAGEQPLLVDFYATWCQPCKIMEPILADVAKELRGAVKIVKVDVDKNPSAANNYQVKGVPTLLLFKDRKILWRQSGVIQAAQLAQTIRQQIG